MEKILFISDGVTVNREGLDFSCYLGNLTHSKVIGVFWGSREMAESRSGSIEVQQQQYKDESIALFKSVCESNGINCLIHKDTGIPVTEVLKESRYTDLLVIDADSSYSNKTENSPTAFVKEILEHSECPVILAPSNFDGIDELVFTYNGSSSSMFAIKQFAHLFPALNHLKVTVLSIAESGNIRGDKTRLKEWLMVHYENAELLVLEDSRISERLTEYLFGKEKVFVVMGAYGRSLLSKMAIPNPAKPVIKIVSHPIFISHY